MNTGLAGSVTSRITQPASQYELSESHLVPIFLTWKSWLNTVSPFASGDCAPGQSLKPVSEAMTGAAGFVMSRMSTSAISWLSAIMTYALPVAGGFAPGTYQAKELCTEWTPLMFGEIAGVESPTPPASLIGADGSLIFTTWTPVPCAPGRPAHSGLNAPR